MGRASHDPAAEGGNAPALCEGLVGASAVLLDAGGRVLLIRRAKAPFAGLWSLPGGHIEPGEAPEATARREVREETGLEVRALRFLTRYDVPLRDAQGRILRTLPLAVFCGRLPDDAAPRASGDVDAARCVPLAELPGLPLTEDCARLVADAARLLATGGADG